MEYVKLGASGVKVSKLCLGMMSYGTAGWPHHPWVLSEADAQPFLKGALDAGINFFDTADFYSVGASEEILGNFVAKNMKRSVKRLTRSCRMPCGKPLIFPLCPRTAWN